MERHEEGRQRKNKLVTKSIRDAKPQGSIGMSRADQTLDSPDGSAKRVSLAQTTHASLHTPDNRPEARLLLFLKSQVVTLKTGGALSEGVHHPRPQSENGALTVGPP